LNIRVAVKENLNANPEAERQFKKEAQLLASLRHPHLPRVTDHFILGDQQYLVMDYIEGIDLHARAIQQPPTVEEVLRWATDLGSALTYLHTRPQPIIHRDIKPANVKLQPDGTVTLVDFGIAKIFEHDQAATTTGARGLTPGYSPPEQYGGARTDARSDQYALAATLYALMTHQSPPDSIERMLNKEHLRPASAISSNVPPHVDAALERAMAVDMEDRFPDIATFVAALRGELAMETIRKPSAHVAAPTVAAAPPRRGSRVWLFVLLGGAGLLGVLLLAGGGALALGALNGDKTTTPATQRAVIVEITSTPRPTEILPTGTAAPQATATPTITPTAAPLLGGGGRIVFVSDRADRRFLQLWTMNPDGSDPSQLTFGTENKQNPRWSPDGRRILYSRPGGVDQYGNDLGLDLFVINADGTNETNLTNSVGDDTLGRWAPDGHSIAFASTRRGGSDAFLYVMPINCDPYPDPCTPGEAKFVSMTDPNFSPESNPAWSPDGGQLAVIARIRGAPGRIYVGGPGGGGGNRFDRADKLIGADDLDWSTTGYLAFTWVQPGSNEIYIVPINDPRGWVKLTSSAGNKEPTFSPDGNFIAFTSTRDQNPEVYRMTSAGADQVNLTNNPARDQQPDWQPYAP
ncbi:MAG TPA: protein kinase, partial [Anaerolineales bacterium]|nr:protein kinase [Anaerolineales bacterium]